MSINLGNTAINGASLGSTTINKLYLGSTVVFDNTGGGGGGNDADYQAVLDEATTQGYVLPTADWQAVQNQMVIDAKANGIWNSLDIAFVFTGNGSKEFKMINWINPTGAKGFEDGGGDLDWDNTGVKGDGAGYINTGWNFLNDSTNYTQNNAGVYLDVVSLSGGGNDNLYHTTNGQSNNFAKDSTVGRPKINSDGSLGPIYTMTEPGLYGNSRGNATQQIHSTELDTSTVSHGSGALQDAELCILGGSLISRGESRIGFVLASSDLSGSLQNIIDSFRAYEPEYNAVFQEGVAQGYTLPTPAERFAQNQIVANLKTTGLWSSLDFFYWFEDSGDSDFKMINWLNPTGAKAVVNGSVTISATGVQGTGSAVDYVALESTNTNMAIGNVSYTWKINTEQVTSDVIFSHGGNGNTTYFDNASALQYIQSNVTSTRDTKDFSGTGIMGATLDGNSFDSYLSGVQDDNSTETGELLANADLHLLRYGSQYGDAEIGFICGGAAYNQTDLYNSITDKYYDDDAEAFIDAVGTLTDDEAEAVNDLVLRLKENGTWTKYKAIYPFVGGTADAHKWNLKDPQDLDSAFRLTFTGGTHDDNGFITDKALSEYADTKFVASTENTDNLISMGFYQGLTTANNDSGDHEFGALGGSWATLQYNQSDFKCPEFSTGEVNVVIAGTSDKGYMAGSRLSSTLNVAMKIEEGATLSTNTNTTSVALGLPNEALSIGALDTGNFANIQAQFAWVGSGHTLQELQDDYNAIEQFQVDLLRGL